ncbi:MAG: hypothetical protein GIS02_01160 [Methanosarcinales archaeon]|uniref:Uncharacterized protein n=1 Tax=Candidatus Ethanoperedens thermophilum TaxID=2766897 RepID=A0A848D933_9EURY|nr:hypothetical protein [Candidatus Ethanoperedens thermophilum]
MFIHAMLGGLNAPKTITGFINDCTIMSAQLIQDVDEIIYRTFRDRCGDLNIDLGKAVTDALDMWLEQSDYDEAFIVRQRKILQEEEFVSLDEI